MLTGLHILLTYRCVFECDHCFVHSSPRARGTFTAARIRDALDQAVGVGSIETVYFEGGEPFLHYPILLEGLAQARARGFRTGIVTNAYWAESVEDAEIWLKPMVERGLGALSVSEDAFHAGPDGAAEPGHAVEAAKRLGIDAGTICIPRPSEGDGVRYRGRAADTLAGDQPVRPWKDFVECPDEDLRDPGRVHLDAYGNVHLCQGVVLGNVWETPLDAIMRDYDPAAHPVVGPLLRGGPAALAEAYDATDLGADCVSACHLCYTVRCRIRADNPDALAPPWVYGETD